MVENLVNARIKINLKDGIVELEGSEQFVQDNIEWLKSIIENGNYKQAFTSDAENIETVVTSSSDSVEKERTEETIDKYIQFFGVPKSIVNQVIHTDELDFKIIAPNIKGTTMDKQINYSLLFCLAKEFYGIPNVSLEELRSVCEGFGCYNAANFASNYNRRKQLFLVDGLKKSKNKTIRLTEPAKKQARELIQSLAS